MASPNTAGAPYEVGFLEEIVGVGWGGLWLGISVGVGITDGSPNVHQSIAANFPDRAGGTPGLPGFVDNVNVDPFPAAQNIASPAASNNAHTGGGAGFIGYAVEAALLIKLGSPGLALPSGESFVVFCPTETLNSAGGDIATADANIALFTDAQITAAIGNDVNQTVQDGPSVARMIRQAGQVSGGTGAPGPLVFTVDPVNRRIIGTGGVLLVRSP